MTPPLELVLQGADTTSRIDGAKDCLLSTTGAACTALQSLVLLAASSTASADQVSPNDAVVAVLSNPQATQASLSEVAGQNFVASFISEIREALGDNLNAETENTLTVLEAQTQTFIGALSVAIDAGEEPSEDRTYLDSMQVPDAHVLAAAFLDSDVPTRIKMVQYYHDGATLEDSVTQVLPQLGESRISMEKFYTPRFMTELTRIVPRGEMPNHLNRGLTLDRDAYIAQLEAIADYYGIYRAYIEYLSDQKGEGFEPNMTEQQFYGVLELAQSSFIRGEWEGDDARRHAGKTRIAMEALMTQKYAEFTGRMRDFFLTIGYEAASELHPEIRTAYEIQLAANAEVEAAQIRGDARVEAVQREADMWAKTRDILGL